MEEGRHFVLKWSCQDLMVRRPMEGSGRLPWNGYTLGRQFALRQQVTPGIRHVMSQRLLDLESRDKNGIELNLAKMN